jgi:hypothetical protein
MRSRARISLLAAIVAGWTFSYPAQAQERVRMALSVRNVVFLPFYCLTLGGSKPSPLGDSFSTFARRYDNVGG